MESFDLHGQSTSTIFPPCTPVSLTLFHHAGASPHVFQETASSPEPQPSLLQLSAGSHPASFAVTFRSSIARERGQMCNLFHKTACKSPLPYLQSLTSLLYSPASPRISQGPLVAVTCPEVSKPAAVCKPRRPRCSNISLGLYFSLISYQ